MFGKFSKKIVKVVVMGSVILSGFVVQNGQAFASTNNNNIVNQATGVLGVPYKWGGTSKKTGFDCSGFLNYVYKGSKVTLPRTAYEMFKKGNTVSPSSLKAGDLVFFKTAGYAPVTHAGMYIGNGKFIHSSSSKGVSINSLNDPYYWGKRFVGAKRILL
ncbi:C40 family peptidase [Aneurinibacillus terranovensis]|uniref:C40 family peptidase n=1 Tax=Aneurinibacillus terranovensis TaxID=278991 RepID=UPI000407A895|nr:C40 family peptidase [Aneurinibacillus terranovensis]